MGDGSDVFADGKLGDLLDEAFDGALEHNLVLFLFHHLVGVVLHFRLQLFDYRIPVITVALQGLYLFLILLHLL